MRRILEHFENLGTVSVRSPELREKILRNPGGDALDSLLAAVAAWTAAKEREVPAPGGDWTREGWVYGGPLKP